jgi:hypothetical protein
VLEQGGSQGLVIVEGHRLVEDRPVAGLLEVAGDTEDEPQRVVVEAGPDVVVPPLGQGLVLVVRRAVGELSGRDVQDPLTRAVRDEVDEPEQVLVRVAEAHAPADPGLEVRG